MEAKRSFREAWESNIAIGEALRDRGWTGEWITIDGPLVPKELAPLNVSVHASQARQGGYGPGRDPDPVYSEFLAEGQERMRQAQAALDRLNLPPGYPR
jgi:hypothetical protein